MTLCNSTTYLKDIECVSKMSIPFERLKNKKIIITGAAGLIGSFLVDTLMYRNKYYNNNISVVAWGHTKKSIEERFSNYLENELFSIIGQDVNVPLNYEKDVDYIIHLASNAHPNLFSTDPVGTIKANIIGLNNLLEFATKKKIERLLYVSSGEVYGQPTDKLVPLDEEYSGYVNITSSRSCYPSSKRAAETLCVSYAEQYNISTIIARPCHIYGPTMTISDSRVHAQFVNNVLNDEDIVLKSKGEQVRSYCYVADCVSALLYILLNGKSKNAYNIAYKNSTTSIYNMALIIAKIGNKEVKFKLPDEKESRGYNSVTYSVLSSKKLESLGWSGQYNLEKGYTNTISVLRELQN